MAHTGRTFFIRKYWLFNLKDVRRKAEFIVSNPVRYSSKGYKASQKVSHFILTPYSDQSIKTDWAQ